MAIFTRGAEVFISCFSGADRSGPPENERLELPHHLIFIGHRCLQCEAPVVVTWHTHSPEGSRSFVDSAGTLTK